MQQQARQNIFKINTNSNSGVTKIVLVGVIGIVGIAIAIKLIRKISRTTSGNRLVDDENVKLATEFNTAIHPGRNWVSDLFTSANKDEIFQIAQNIKNFDDVSKEYNNLYQKSLTLELQDALGDEYPAFIAQLQKVKSGTNVLAASDTSKLVIDLRNQIQGLNISGRDLTPFNNLLRLSDADYKRVVQAYNMKYQPDNFYKDLEGESGISALSGFGLFGGTGGIEFDKIKQKLLNRYQLLLK